MKNYKIEIKGKKNTLGGSKAATRSGIRGTEAEESAAKNAVVWSLQRQRQLLQSRSREVNQSPFSDVKVIGGSSRAKRDLGVTEIVDDVGKR